MNILIIAVILVVIFLLVFVMFSLDDHEDEEGFLSDDNNQRKEQPPIQTTDKDNKTTEIKQESNQIHNIESNTIVIEKKDINQETIETKPDTNIINNVNNIEEQIPPKEEIHEVKQSMEETEKIKPEPSIQIKEENIFSEQTLPSNIILPEVGSEDDFKFRLNLDERVSVATSIEKIRCIAAVIQIRFPEDLKRDPDKFLRMLQRAERVIESDYAFPFKGYYLNQLNRVWLFEKNTEDPLSDPLFESLVVAFEVKSKFKMALKEDSILSESKARVTVGLSMGEVFRIEHGSTNPPIWYGKPVYMAEALADSALDLQINVDESIHREALPLFDFREWKPIMLRATIPPAQMFELIGWNNPSEIVSFSNHQNPEARRAVAIAFRYLEFLDDHMSTLFSLASDTNDEVRYEALITIKSLANDRMTSILKYIFPETKPPEFRAAILDTFGEIGNKELIPIVSGSTKESNWIVRIAAAKALYKLSGKDALKQLTPLLKDNDGCVKATANYIFYVEEGRIEYLKTLVELSSGLSKRAKAAAIDALLDINTEVSLKEVINAFPEQSTDLQRHILRRLETENSQILYQCFLALFKNSSEKIRPYIIESVKRAGIIG